MLSVFDIIIIIIIIILYLPSDFRVAYAANISEHLPTQPWDYRHKVQTTTPGTTSPTLREQWVGSLTSHRVIYEQGLWDGTSGLSSLSEKTRKSNHLQMSLQRQHFLLSYLFIYLKTLSVGPAGVWTHDLPHGSPVLYQELYVLGDCTYVVNPSLTFAKLHRCI